MMLSMDRVIDRYDNACAYELLYATIDSPEVVNSSAVSALEWAGFAVDKVTCALLLVAGEAIAGSGALDTFVRPPREVLTAALDSDVSEADVERARVALMAMSRVHKVETAMPKAATDAVDEGSAQGRDLETVVAVARLMAALLPDLAHPENRRRMLNYAQQVRAKD